MTGVLRVGDIVQWRGGFGNHVPKLAVVIELERVQPGEKDGDAVPEMDWDQVRDHAVVTLDNGHWAYGAQLSPVDNGGADAPISPASPSEGAAHVNPGGTDGTEEEARIEARSTAHAEAQEEDGTW